MFWENKKLRSYSCIPVAFTWFKKVYEKIFAWNERSNSNFKFVVEIERIRILNPVCLHMSGQKFNSIQSYRCFSRSRSLTTKSQCISTNKISRHKTEILEGFWVIYPFHRCQEMAKSCFGHNKKALKLEFFLRSFLFFRVGY